MKTLSLLLLITSVTGVWNVYQSFSNDPGSLFARESDYPQTGSANWVATFQNKQDADRFVSEKVSAAFKNHRNKKALVSMTEEDRQVLVWLCTVRLNDDKLTPPNGPLAKQIEQAIVSLRPIVEK